MTQSPRLKFIVATNGSDGDVHPFFGLAQSLKTRGHDVVIVSNERYAALGEMIGCGFESADSSAALQKVMDDVDPAKIFSTFSMLDGLALRPMERFLDKIAEHHEPGRTVLIAFPLVFGARMAHDKLGIPFVSAHLAPSAFMSALDPPRPGPSKTLFWMPPMARRLVFWLMVKGMDFALKNQVDALRKKHGLPRQRNLWRWASSPQKVVALFPAWFAGPQPDWPAHAETTDFPRFDVGHARPLPDDVEAFLATGDQPVVFTAGSPAKGVSWFFKGAVKACKATGSRGIFVTRHLSCVPQALPSGIMHTTHAPFRALFQRSVAVVHHGGIGTCAEALAAGIPQMVVPWGADQFDNATRIERLGVGFEVPRKTFASGKGGRALGRLLEDENMRVACEKTKRQFNVRDEMAYICDRLEAFSRAALYGLARSKSHLPARR
jgi:UDP:flavonoid glycosyltransferase YjiC (YdhE family)